MSQNTNTQSSQQETRRPVWGYDPGWPEYSIAERRQDLQDSLDDGAIHPDHVENVKAVIRDIDNGDIGDYYHKGKRIERHDMASAIVTSGGPIWSEARYFEHPLKPGSMMKMRPRWDLGESRVGSSSEL
ncbi:hypothetical protein TWF281_003277 [Arthrobotrys megalospora]